MAGLASIPATRPRGPTSSGEATYLMPESAAHVQDLIPFPDRADLKHLPLDLLDQRAFVGAIKPAEDCLGAT